MSMNKTLRKTISNYPRCNAKTRAGGRCQKPPLQTKTRCRLHGGASTGPKTAEGKARIALAQFKHGRYCRWRERRALERAYYAMIRKVMDDARLAGLLPD